MFAELKVKRIMKALNTLELSPCPTNCLFSCIIINQSYSCSYCTALGAVMSEGLTLKGFFHSCPWILDQVLLDENGPCTGEAVCGPSCLWVLITVKFISDAETPQKARPRLLLLRCPQKLTDSPSGGKRHCRKKTVFNKPQIIIEILDFVLHVCILDWKFLKQIVWSRCVNSSVTLHILFTVPSQMKKYNMNRWSYLRHALCDNWPSL